MLDLKDIRSEVSRLTELIEGWEAVGVVPPIERDLVLDKLKGLYEAVRFSDGTVHEAEPVSDGAKPWVSSAELVTAAIDLDEVMPLDIPALSFPEAAVPSPVENDTSGSISPQMESRQQHVAAKEYVAEAPAADTVPELRPLNESGESLRPADKPAPEEKDGMGAVRPAVAENSLFDLDELTVRRRESRRVLMSLYDDDEPRAVQPKKRTARPAAPAPDTEARPLRAAAQPFFAEVVLGDAPEAVKGPSVGPDETSPEEITLPVRAVETARHEPAARETTAEGPAMAESEPEMQTRELHPVLGEVINRDVQTLGETISAPDDVASRLVRSEPIVDLREGLGVNDRFLLLRDLFTGDEALYERTMEELNGFDDLDDCMIYIAENFAWNPNSDGARFLTELLERKLGR